MFFSHIYNFRNYYDTCNSMLFYVSSHKNGLDLLLLLFFGRKIQIKLFSTSKFEHLTTMFYVIS